MSTTITKPNTRRHYTIKHNGVEYDQGVSTYSPIMKKAHHIVRDFLMAEWLRHCTNLETTAVIMADGLQVASVYGFHKNRSIRIVHR